MTMNKPDSSPTKTINYFSQGDKREELTEILTSRLIECGWRDQVSVMCRNLIQKHGVENIRLEQIVGEIGNQARQMVPDQVRAELLELIRKTNQSQLEPTTQKETVSNSTSNNLNQIDQSRNATNLLCTPPQSLPTTKEEDVNSLLNDSDL